MIGLGLLAFRLPFVRLEQPLLFLALLSSSVLISVSKVHLPLASGSATLSMSYFTDFMALVLLGPDEAMIVAGVERGDAVPAVDAQPRAAATDRFSVRL